MNATVLMLHGALQYLGYSIVFVLIFVSGKIPFF